MAYYQGTGAALTIVGAYASVVTLATLDYCVVIGIADDSIKVLTHSNNQHQHGTDIMKRQYSKGERVWIQELIEHLRDLSKDDVEPLHHCGGICWELKIRFNGGNLVQLAEFWSLYSGNPKYPVPYRKDCPFYAYAFMDMWGKGEYGNNRRDLCEFLADTIEELTRE